MSRSFLLIAATGALLAAAGCAAPPRLDPGRLGAARAGLDRAIQFSAIGGEIDVPEGLGDTGTLALPIAVERAVRESPAVQGSLARFRIALAEAKQERLLPNPVLSLVFRFPEAGGSPTVEAGLAADLLSLLSKPGRVEVADSRLRAAAADVETAVLDVVAEVESRYVAVQADGDLVRTFEDRVAILDRLLGVTRSRLQSGEGTRLDVLGLETQRQELLSELADQRLQLTEDRLSLARLLGTPSSPADWVLSRWEPSPPDGTGVSEKRWVALGLEHRPEVRRQRNELAALGREVTLTGLAALEGGDAGVHAERDAGEWTVGPALTTPIPIFDWGQARHEQAEARVAEALHELTGLSRQIVEETRRSYAAFTASQENLRRVRSELLPLSRQRLEQAVSQFRGGQTDVTALLQSEEQTRASRTREVQLERRRNESLIRLERAVGGRSVIAGAVGGTPSAATTTPSSQPVNRP